MGRGVYKTAMGTGAWERGRNSIKNVEHQGWADSDQMGLEACLVTVMCAVYCCVQSIDRLTGISNAS